MNVRTAVVVSLSVLVLGLGCSSSDTSSAGGTTKSCGASSAGSSTDDCDASSGGSTKKTCLVRHDGFGCACSADADFEKSDIDGVPYGHAESCEPAELHPSYCCAKPAKEGKHGEQCQCDALVCLDSGGRCTCASADYFSSSSFADVCPKPKASGHCCNRRGEAFCECTDTDVPCNDDSEEVEACSVDVLAKDCDGDKTYVEGRCAFPSEL